MKIYFFEQKHKYLENHRKKWDREISLKNILSKMEYGKKVLEEEVMKKIENLSAKAEEERIKKN